MYVTLDIGISATAVKSNRGEGTMKRGDREKNKWFKQKVMTVCGNKGIPF